MAQKRFDSKKVEKAAILAVSNLVQQCEAVDVKLDSDDKNILVDGSFELYKGPVLTIANFIGKVDVQVKGKTGKINVNRRGFVKYPIAVEDLRRYQDVFHGVLFFCVAVGDENGRPVGKEVYYCQLLPYDINMLLSETKPGQKKVSARFKPFPTEPKEIARLLSAFHAEQERQLGAKVSGYGFLDRNYDLPPDIESFNFSMKLFPGEQVTTLSSFHEGPYIYGRDEKGELTVFGKMGDVSAFALGVEATVSSGGFSEKTTVFSGESEEGDFLEFGGIRLFLSEGKARLDYTVSGGLRRRYNTVSFVQEFMRTGVLELNGEHIVTAKMENVDEEQIRRLDESVRLFGRMVQTLEVLHVQADWDPSELSDKELNDIGFMHRLLIEKKPFANGRLESPLVHFDIQGGWVFAFARVTNEDTYDFLNLFTEDLCFVFGGPDEETGESKFISDPVPPLAALGREGFEKVLNLDPEGFSRSLSRFPVTASNQSPLNQKLLEMLEAYDAGCNQPDEVLACAAILARSLYEFDTESETYCLNLMQTLKRRRELDKDERNHLEDLALDGSTMYVRAAAFSLLDNCEMAGKCLSRCTANEQKQLIDYPIYRFFDRASGK